MKDDFEDIPIRFRPFAKLIGRDAVEEIAAEVMNHFMNKSTLPEGHKVSLCVEEDK